MGGALCRHQPPRRRRSWAELSADIVREVVRSHIPCEVDRLAMELVCRSWRAALVGLDPPARAPPPLPWLVLPEADGPAFYCFPSGCRTHPFFVLHGARRSRYFGSYGGAWLFLAVDPAQGKDRDHVLVNLISFEFLDLPNMIHDQVFLELEFESEIVIVAATLSSHPTEQGCIVAGIINYCPFPQGRWDIAFWRMGDRVVLRSFGAENACMEVEDLIHHDGHFHFLTRGEHIRVSQQVIFHQFHDQEEVEEDVEVNWEVLLFQPRGDDEEQVLARYLVESRGSLLMVVRFTPRPHYLPTTAFRVFAREDQVLNDDEPAQHSWRELSALGGRMLFVGRGCSRSYEAAGKYPVSYEGVYFLDDRSFRDTAILCAKSAERQFPCSDNGKWSRGPPQIDRCFPELGLSNYSPPVWILP